MTLCKLFFTTLLTALFISCGPNSAQQEKQKDTSTSTNLQQEPPKAAAPKAAAEEPLQIGTFSSLPPEIDGCGCRLSASGEDFKKKTYLFVDDGQENAFIRINNKMMKFHFEDSKSISDKHSVSTYSNGEYSLIIDIEQTGQGEEVWEQKGTLKLTTKDGKSVVKNIIGTCGC